MFHPIFSMHHKANVLALIIVKANREKNILAHGEKI